MPSGERGISLSPESPAGWLQAKLANSWLHPLHLAHLTLARAVELEALHARGRVLDVGCGGQRYRRLFTQTDTYLGVDLPSNSAAVPVLDAFADGLRLPFPDATFDTVLCTEVLEHVPEPKALMCEAARVLRSAGKLILTTPQTWGLHEAPHDYYRYTEFGLRYLATQAGLSVCRVRPTCGLWATVGQRLSSFLFYTVSARWPVPLRGLMALACAPLQLVAWALDCLFKHAGDPLDHLLVAEKP